MFKTRIAMEDPFEGRIYEVRNTVFYGRTASPAHRKITKNETQRVAHTFSEHRWFRLTVECAPSKNSSTTRVRQPIS